MKIKAPEPGALWRRLNESVSLSGVRRSLHRAVDRGLVTIGWMPQMMDGSGKILHISDTPVCMYRYLARLLRRVNPSVVIHTGDFADDIKLEMYPGEAEHYRVTVARFVSILLAPHRRVYLALGNHDRRDLLPPLPRQCAICDDAMEVKAEGATFRVSHYAEAVMSAPARFNLFGHTAEPESFIDGESRCFLNGLEAMRLIDPKNGEITLFRYPRGTDDMRLMRRKRCST